jgi:predicted Kef-type K+ transport protein
MIGYLLAWLIAVLLIGIGLAAGLAPGAVAWGFGMPANEPAARFYVRATGSRDLILGLILILQIMYGATRILAPSLALGAFIAAADLALVLGTSGTRRLAGVIHGSSTVLLLVAAACVAYHR